MSLLFETILIKHRKPVNLSYHEKRFNASRRHFWKSAPLSLGQLITVSDLDEDKLYRCRIDYSSEIDSVKFSSYVPVTIKFLQIILCNDVDYSFKYSDRAELEKLYYLKKSSDDILIVKKGNVTDTSTANIVFFTGKEYITPAHPLLEGTQRSFLLENGIITEKDIKLEDIRNFKSWQHINALNPFDKSRFMPVTTIHL